MSTRRRILIVEDERVIGNFLKITLAHGGYAPVRAENGREALEMSLTYNPDLILLDLGLPDVDGMVFLTEYREWSDTPVIIVSAREEEREKIAALDAGANDYITKPFGGGELLARIRVALRQHDKFLNRQQESSFVNGSLEIDYAARLVKVNGSAVHLTPIEYKILILLARNINKVLTHEYILRDIWGEHFGDSQTLRVNIANIRKKIEPQSATPTYILTEVGVGYRMVDAHVDGSARE